MKKPGPPSGAIVEKKRGNKRYYYYSRSYRVKLDPDAKGKTKGSGRSKVVSEQVYLGTAEAVMEKIRSLTEICEPREVQKKQFGLPMALFDMAEKIRLREIINRIAPGRVNGISIGDFVLIAAINRVGGHCSKEGMGRWYKKTDLRRLQGIDATQLNSKNFWYAFDTLISEAQIKQEKERRGLALNDKLDIEELEEVLDDSKIVEIEKEIWERLSREFGFLLDVILYDTTNFYSYYQPNTRNSLGQFGKNKQHQNDKRQVGLQLGILRNLGIPVFHNVYCGQQNDAKLFPSAIRTLVSRYHQVMNGTERLTLVFDKGNNSAEGISLLEQQDVPLDFIGALTPSHHRDLISLPLASFSEKVGKFRIHRTRKEVFGKERLVVITYNEATVRRKEELFERQMKRIMAEAKAYFETIKKDPTNEVQARMETFLKTKKVGTSQALRFYTSVVAHNGWVNTFSLRRKQTEVKLKKKEFGKKLLFTSLPEETTTEAIVSHYKSAYQVEDAFHHIKDRDLISYWPARHWTDSKIRVHAFVCVLALLLVKLLNYLAQNNDMEMSTKILIEELADISLVIMVYPGGKAVRKVSEMSAVQKRLFFLYGLDRYS